MITNFLDAFTYVNKRYIFNEDNYPIMLKMGNVECKIFALKHGLLHMIKSANGLREYTPQQKQDIEKLAWLTKSNQNLSPRNLASKNAILKTIVNIVSISNTAGFTVENLSKLKTPTEKELIQAIPITQMKNPREPTFEETISYVIEKLATVLEKADHDNIVDTLYIQGLVKMLWLSMLYWFDADWVPEFLAQIPDVMKSR